MTLVAKIKKRFYFAAASYFKFFANISFKKWHPRVIAVTGSVGKTTMLNLLESQIGAAAHYSHNANSAFGISFDILGLRGVTGSKLYWLYLLIAAPARAFTYHHTQKFYIVEIDGERPRETQFIATWLKPEVTLWISLGLSHAVWYENQVKSGLFATTEEAIAAEFATLPQNTQKLTIFDADNKLMQQSLQTVLSTLKEKHVIAVSKNKISGYKVTPETSEFTLDKHTFKFAYPMPQDISIQLVMLTELMKYLNLPIDYSMQNFTLPPARNNPLKGKNGLRIIDSSYNAHLISMASILQMSRSLKVPHKWLILGDMVEQGNLEKTEHQKLAKLIEAAKPEQVILLGRRTATYTYPLLKKSNTVSFASPQEALEYLEKHLTGKETLIFKGSQYLEWIIEKLLDDPTDANLLARQDPAHKARRKSWGLE